MTKRRAGGDLEALERQVREGAEDGSDGNHSDQKGDTIEQIQARKIVRVKRHNFATGAVTTDNNGPPKGSFTLQSSSLSTNATLPTTNKPFVFGAPAKVEKPAAEAKVEEVK